MGVFRREAAVAVAFRLLLIESLPIQSHNYMCCMRYLTDPGIQPELHKLKGCERKTDIST